MPEESASASAGTLPKEGGKEGGERGGGGENLFNTYLRFLTKIAE